VSSSSELKKQGSSSTIVSSYAANSSTNDIVAISKVQHPTEKPDDVDYSLHPLLTVDQEACFSHNPTSRATREYITALPVVPDKV
jgi:hypothetical protein